VLLSSYRNTNGHLGGQEMLWEHKPVGECFHSYFEFSQILTGVSVKQLDDEL